MRSMPSYGLIGTIGRLKRQFCGIYEVLTN